MKLEHACEAYGLKPASAGSIDDYQNWRHIEETMTSEKRVTRIISQLNTRVFGAALVVAEVIFGDDDQSSGMNFSGLGRHGEYAWNVTMSMRDDRTWSCGLVEAMYRRYVDRMLDVDVMSQKVRGMAEAWQASWEA